MDVGRALVAIRAQLPPEMVERLAFVTLEHRPEPNADDVARGAGPNHRAYFYGHCIDRPAESTELPDEEPPRGAVVLFTNRICPLSLENVTKIFLHEIGHALGFDHDVLEDELGLV